MAFISASLATVNTASSLHTARTCNFAGSRVNVAATRRSAVLPTPTSTTVMTTAPKYPASTVLGLGQDVPSSLYIIASAIALPLGCYSVYMSNIVNILSADTVNPQFIIGSLLVPISWGLHVAGFIQKKNNK